MVLQGAGLEASDDMLTRTMRTGIHEGTARVTSRTRGDSSSPLEQAQARENSGGDIQQAGRQVSFSPPIGRSQPPADGGPWAGRDVSAESRKSSIGVLSDADDAYIGSVARDFSDGEEGGLSTVEDLSDCDEEIAEMVDRPAPKSRDKTLMALASRLCVESQAPHRVGSKDPATKGRAKSVEPDRVAPLVDVVSRSQSGGAAFSKGDKEDRGQPGEKQAVQIDGSEGGGGEREAMDATLSFRVKGASKKKGERSSPRPSMSTSRRRSVSQPECVRAYSQDAKKLHAVEVPLEEIKNLVVGGNSLRSGSDDSIPEAASSRADRKRKRRSMDPSRKSPLGLRKAGASEGALAKFRVESPLSARKSPDTKKKRRSTMDEKSPSGKRLRSLEKKERKKKKKVGDGLDACARLRIVVKNALIHGDVNQDGTVSIPQKFNCNHIYVKVKLGSYSDLPPKNLTTAFTSTDVNEILMSHGEGDRQAEQSSIMVEPMLSMSWNTCVEFPLKETFVVVRVILMGSFGEKDTKFERVLAQCHAMLHHSKGAIRLCGMHSQFVGGAPEDVRSEGLFLPEPLGGLVDLHLPLFLSTEENVRGSLVMSLKYTKPKKEKGSSKRKFAARVQAGHPFQSLSAAEVKWLIQWAKGQGSIQPELHLAACKLLCDFAYPDERVAGLRADIVSSGAFNALLDLSRNGALCMHHEVDMDQVELGSEIGMGAAGKVHKGRYNGRDVAVKSCNFLSLGALVSDTRFEVALMCMLLHPRLLPCMGASITNERAFMIMPLAEQGGLDVLLYDTSRHFDLLSLVEIASQISEGMIYLHSCNVIHRDLKSSNVLLMSDSSVVLTDFGTSRSFNSRSAQYTHNIGTTAWMAPEMFEEDASYTQKVDVYSFAIILWEMFARELPYKDVRNWQIPKLVLSGSRPDIPKSCPKVMQTLIRDCWDQDWRRRPEFEQVHEQLVAIAHQLRLMTS